MTEWIILAALVIALALASLLVSVFALMKAQHASRASAAEVERACQECARAVEAMQTRFESMAAEVRDSPRRIAAEPLPAAPKLSMNLSRRSQALRLRRKGESPAKIAETLEIPRQEVNLLLKVHEIVLNNL